MCKFIKPQIPQDATPEEKHRIMFDCLNALDLSDKVEKRNGLSYLSWSAAWNEFKAAYPTATYEIVKNPQTGLPYFPDPNLGIFVFTRVTADDLTYEMWLPVMDSKNKAMKETPYTYTVWNEYKKQYEEKTVAAATAFNINTSLMRCLCKNLCMFGLGLYIYNGDDLPAQSNDNKQQQAQQQSTTPSEQKPYDRFATIKTSINKAQDVNALLSLYLDHQTEIDANPQIKALLTQRKQQLQMLTQNN